MMTGNGWDVEPSEQQSLRSPQQRRYYQSSDNVSNKSRLSGIDDAQGAQARHGEGRSTRLPGCHRHRARRGFNSAPASRCPRTRSRAPPIARSPYWAKRLNKTEMFARQISARGGEIFCKDHGPRVRIKGRCASYLEGTMVL